MIHFCYIGNDVARHRPISPILLISHHFHETNFPLWIWTQHLSFFLEFLACTSANTIYVGRPTFLILRIVIRLYHTIPFFNYTFDITIFYIPVVRLIKRPASTYLCLFNLSVDLRQPRASLFLDSMRMTCSAAKKVEYQNRRF